MGDKMNSRKKTKLNIKSEVGFTLQDLTIAMLILSIFVGVIGTLMYNSYKVSLESKVLAQAVNYSVHILEDIDKRPYNEIDSTLVPFSNQPENT